MSKKYTKGLCSICCLTYKQAPYIEKAIKSIWNQKYKNIEIIALDDGSPDESGRILQELQKKSTIPMKVILQKNTGMVPKSFNDMIRKAKGEFISFISLDDKLYSDAISIKINLMKKNENIAFIASNKWCEIDNEDNVKKICSFLPLDKFPEPTINDLIEVESKYLHTFHIQGNVFRRSVIDAVHGFDDDLVGDDIVLRNKIFLYLKNNSQYTFQMIGNPSVYYRIHGGNVHKNRYRQIKIIAECLARYYPERPLPASVESLMVGAVKELPFFKAISAFFINRKTFALFIPTLKFAFNRLVRNK